MTADAIVADVAAAVEQRVSYLRCHHRAPTEDGWVRCADLITDPDRLAVAIADTAAGRGTTDPQVAASLFVQDYSFRLPSIAVAAYALNLPVPSVAPTTTAIRMKCDRPAEVAILDPACVAGDAESLTVAVLDDHLAPFIGAVRATTRIGERLLWGNVAASLARIFRAVQSSTGPLGDPAVRERAVEFERAASERLGGLGSYCTIEAPGALGWWWTRTNCCLWYQTEGGWRCDDCSLHQPSELAEKRRAELDEATS